MKYNDLARYKAVADKMLPGDLILFDGSANSDVVDLVEHVLPNGIEVFTHSNWSHSALVNGPGVLLESTILKGVDGPQYNDMLTRFAEYDGCNISWLALTDDARAILHVDQGMSWARSLVGIDRYSKLSILDFVLRTALVGRLFPSTAKSRVGQEDCSEFAALAYRKMGAEALVGSVQTHVCVPQTLYKWPIFKPIVRLV